MKIYYENQQTYAKLMVEVMPAKYTYTRCNNACQRFFLHAGICIQRLVGSRLDKIKPAAAKKRSDPIFREKDQNVKMKASVQQADERKINALVLMCFVCYETLCLKQWVA